MSWYDDVYKLWMHVSSRTNRPVVYKRYDKYLLNFCQFVVRKCCSLTLHPLFLLDCDSGTYGADCNQTCSTNCLFNACDRYTGVCNYGCLPGYIMPYCRESKIHIYIYDSR